MAPSVPGMGEDTSASNGRSHSFRPPSGLSAENTRYWPSGETAGDPEYAACVAECRFRGDRTGVQNVGEQHAFHRQSAGKSISVLTKGSMRIFMLYQSPAHNCPRNVLPGYGESDPY